MSLVGGLGDSLAGRVMVQVRRSMTPRIPADETVRIRLLLDGEHYGLMRTNRELVHARNGDVDDGPEPPSTDLDAWSW